MFIIIYYCKISSSNNFINDWIKNDFKKWFIDNILVEEILDEFENNEEENESEFIFRKQKRDHYKPVGKSNVVDFDLTPWGILINDNSVRSDLSRRLKVLRDSTESSFPML